MGRKGKRVTTSGINLTAERDQEGRSVRHSGLPARSIAALLLSSAVRLVPIRLFSFSPFLPFKLHLSDPLCKALIVPGFSPGVKQTENVGHPIRPDC